MRPCSLIAILIVFQAGTTLAQETEWKEAHDRFVEFITPHVESQRQLLKDPGINYAWVRDPLLAEHLPALHLYVVDTNLGSASRIYFLEPTGAITDAGHGEWSACTGGEATLPRITEFLQSRSLPLASATDAINIARVIETIIDAPNKRWFIRYNTKNLTVLDPTLFCMAGDCGNDWEYSAKKTAYGWSVTREYIGPPASIGEPPVYILEPDKEGNFETIRRRCL